MTRPLVALPLLLAACSVGEPAPSESSPAQAPGSTEAAATPTQTAVTRVARYTSLERCRLVREERKEMPFTEVLCSGPAGWAVRIADSDARQVLTVVPPQGRETRLDTARIGGGGFSSFGSTAEWRGPAAEPFRPDALIVRFRVAEEPHPAPETGYLLVIRLAPEPCVVAHLRPGPGQNAQARAAADRAAACLAD